MTINEIIKNALAEDIGDGDHTSLSCIPYDAKGKARLIVKSDGILAGVEIAEKVFSEVDPRTVFTRILTDGAMIKNGDIAFTVEGFSRSLLQSERLALNFMQRMSGIATATNKLVKLIEGTGARLLDTRKTTPLLREIEKAAVRIGGGFNHRMGLYDMIMIKDNHVDFAGGIEKAIQSTHEYLRKHNKNLEIVIEARNIEEVKKIILFGGVTRIMLDNFTPGIMKEAVDLIGKKFETEASGGINSDTIREYALTGVDFISVGAITHHIKSLDMSLKAY